MALSHTGEGLFQERLRHEPFWMLVACILVNRTRWSVAEPVLAAVRERWPTFEALADSDSGEVENVMRRLGFQRRRTAVVRELAFQWTCHGHHSTKTVDDVCHLPGCGRYAADSWAIFIEGRLDVEPTDRALKAFLTNKLNE